MQVSDFSPTYPRTPCPAWEQYPTSDSQAIVLANEPRESFDINNAASHRRECAPSKKLTNSDYTVAWVSALPIERAAAEAMLDGRHQKLPKAPGDTNNYTYGEIGNHNVVISILPHDGPGTINAATVAGNMHRTFPSLEVFLMVGIAGGAPGVADVRLGDVVVSSKLIQYDLGKALGQDCFETMAIPLRSTQELRMAVAALQAQHEARPSTIPNILYQITKRNPHMDRYMRPNSSEDLLFESTYEHPISVSTCNQCNQARLVKRTPRRNNDPMIHYGVIASGDQVVKCAIIRDKLAQRFGALCFEMEGAGPAESFQCLVIRSICDYSDSHKNDEWQRYAAATAAAYTKELLGEMPILESQASKINVDELSSARKRDIMQSLSFQTMYSREWNIESASNKTCEWFLWHPTFLTWIDPEKYSQTHGILWIRGKPGAGKSTLMKFIATEASENDLAVISFFFNARGGELEYSLEGMYRSLLYQLLDKVPDLQLLDHPHLRLLASGSPFDWNIGILQELFSHAIAGLGYQEVICFVDALDECDVSQVQRMITHFESLGSLALEKNLKLLICFSSRHYPAILIRTGLILVLEDQNGHSQDLEAYVNHELEINDEEHALDIKYMLLQKAAGVFLWVVLVVRILNEDCLGGRMFGLKARLNEIPSELYDLFRNILKKDGKNGADLLLSIQWILYAKEPLDPALYYSAMAVGLNPGEDSMAEQNPWKVSANKIDRFVSSSSKGLAEVTKSPYPRVQFIHESVRDFLIKDGGICELWPRLQTDFENQSHDRLKDCCYKFIKAQSSNIEELELELKTELEMETELNTELYTGKFYSDQDMNYPPKYAFLAYATNNVLYHADLAAASVPQQDFLEKFDLRTWIRLGNKLLYPRGGYDYTLSANIIYVLADQGYARLIDNVVAIDGSSVHVYGETYKYPLFAALRSRHDGVVDAILRGAKSRVDCNDTVPQLPSNCETLIVGNHTPLTLAIQCEHMEVIHLLLNQGLLLNTAKPDGQTPLMYAAMMELPQISQLLVDKGADVDAKDNNGETALFTAVRGTLIETVQILLDGGADINLKNKRGKTALSAEVTWMMSLETMQLLLDRGANIHLKDKDGETALFNAARLGSLEVLQMLLDRGANIHSKNGDGETALFTATIRGSLKIIELLLNRGAKINSKDKYGETALFTAARRGSLEIIELLLNRGAKINSKDKYGETALFDMVIYQSLGVIELLLNRGSNVNSTSNLSDTPLIYAISYHRTEVIRLLLARGAFVNVFDRNGITPLQLAVEKGYDEVAEMLLAQGADPNVLRNDGVTPLRLAIREGRKQTTQRIRVFHYSPIII